MEQEYLDLKDLCRKIPFSPQTIYNLISKGRLVHGVHYFKPSPKKLVFKWSAMVQWLEGSTPGTSQDVGLPEASPVSDQKALEKPRKPRKAARVVNLINI